ncbi:exonuclease domain-containing protein [Streptomyces sp. NPDC087218]|uniref:exonuclease domain-containing protein n=1 Tax=Streptomyces sp. NPDC087218 TaxID=3365769 RepID=UPI0037FB2CA6
MGRPGPTIAWAQKILADPDAYAILDTETTGLDYDSRIVEIAVTTAAGTVLLDTLVNPGAPIPAEAAAIHGITDVMVADAPSTDQHPTNVTTPLARLCGVGQEVLGRALRPRCPGWCLACETAWRRR